MTTIRSIWAGRVTSRPIWSVMVMVSSWAAGWEEAGAEEAGAEAAGAEGAGAAEEAALPQPAKRLKAMARARIRAVILFFMG